MIYTLAPIVLFVYNRPWHTEQTLNTLMQNDLADQSVLYIYADGAKDNATDDQIKSIADVRHLIRSKKWCKEVIIKERENNKGLADSVINGVTELMNIHEKVIVLEDDIVTSPHFLSFMNTALNYYNEYNIVAGISGFTYPSTIKVNNKIHFLSIGSSWGWATWKRQWETIEFDSGLLLKEITTQKLTSKFDFGGCEFYKMLKLQDEGKLSSWAIRFYASFFLQNKYFAYAPKSLVQNIGFGTDATHTTASDNFLSQINISNNSEFKFRKPRLDSITESVKDAFSINYPQSKSGNKIKLLTRLISGIKNKSRKLFRRGYFN